MTVVTSEEGARTAAVDVAVDVAAAVSSTAVQVAALLINSFPDAPKPPALTKPTTGRAAHASCRRG